MSPQWKTSSSGLRSGGGFNFTKGCRLNSGILENVWRTQSERERIGGKHKQPQYSTYSIHITHHCRPGWSIALLLDYTSEIVPIWDEIKAIFTGILLRRAEWRSPTRRERRSIRADVHTTHVSLTRVRANSNTYNSLQTPRITSKMGHTEENVFFYRCAKFAFRSIFCYFVISISLCSF